MAQTRHFHKYNMTVGPQELIDPKKFDVILNVSDSPCWLEYPESVRAARCLYNWFPINEMRPWGLAPFYWSKRILDNAAHCGQKIGIHCHAGAHRSPIIALLWMLSLEKPDSVMKQWEGQDWSFTVDGRESNIWSMYGRDKVKGIVPDNIAKLHQLMRLYPSYSLMGLEQLLNKKEETFSY